MASIWDTVGSAPFSGEKQRAANALVARLRHLHHKVASEGRTPTESELHHCQLIMRKLIDEFDADPRGLEELFSVFKGKACEKETDEMKLETLRTHVHEDGTKTTVHGIDAAAYESVEAAVAAASMPCTVVFVPSSWT